MLNADRKLIYPRILVVLAIVSLVILYDLSPLGGNIRFYSKWITCGQKPVATLGAGYLNSGARHYIEAPTLSISRPSIEYFCSPLEAEKAGYSASADIYYFPNLNPQQ